MLGFLRHFARRMAAVVDPRPTVEVYVDGKSEFRHYSIDTEGCMPCYDIDLKPGERLIHGDINDPRIHITTKPE